MINELTEALWATEIPFAIDGWDPAPDGNYGVLALTGVTLLRADDAVQDALERYSVDLYCLDEGSEDATKIMRAMNSIDAPWVMVGRNFDQSRGLMHYRWTVSE